MIRFDGHIHSPYCPHGTSDSFEQYIEKALELGFEQISFTEHAPLPESFCDPVPTKDSAMTTDQLQRYLEHLLRLKKVYKEDITINIGLEVDYIEGYESDTRRLLNEWGNHLDDAILSVHFLKNRDNYRCLDYSWKEFETIIKEYGSLEKVYKKYFETLILSIQSDLGPHKPKRIGHITLVRKFQELFPRTFDDSSYVMEVLTVLQREGLVLDVNGAGLVKPYCNEFYPPIPWILKAKEMGIPFVYGSDAHRANLLGTGLEQVDSILGSTKSSQ
ncbi:histidinol-phosphatase HisJ [Evansella tamaricis]|uniref:Histidinol-phosphatase n=1 Tax=Evansella tamaricis TaxID=2069301 RepID=A0ABS6JLW3_9BACI|nr:histidinol-phosphatase HisJ [Evansella tamaricis]MBU9714666.1 histidinol-phosphatase HisJ [Evansella tamaricis]